MPTNRHATTQLIRRAAFAAASLTLVGIVVPVVLVGIAGWPLPSAIPDVGQTLTAIRQQNLPDGFVLGAFATIAWLLWAQLAWALIWELAVNTRRLAAGIDVRPAPLVISTINDFVARLASGTVAISIMAATPAAAAALPVAPAPAVVDLAAIQPVLTTIRQAGMVDTASHRVQWHVHDGDTGWSIAERALGDGSRFGEIVRLNPSIRTPRDISPGVTLTLPEGAKIPADRNVAEQETPKTAGAAAEDQERRAAATTVGYLPAEDTVIVIGDHLWGLSEQRLEQVGGTEPSNAEVLEHVNTVIDLNEDIVEDPDLIYPGEVFTFPAIGTPTPAAPIIERQTESTLTETPDEPPKVEEVAGELIADPAPTLETDNLADSSDTRSVLPYLLGLAGATVLATSLLAAIRAGQRSREARGTPVSSDPASTLERTVTAAANLPLIKWAGQELSILIPGLSPAVAANSKPLAVEVSETGIELLWDGPTVDAPHPWEATDGGAAWRLLFDPDAPTPADNLPPAIPALVTIGVRPGEGVVLLDLETLGSVSVTGDDSAVNDLVRSLALELASGTDLASADVVTVGFDVDAQRHFPRISSATEDDALALVRSTVEQYDVMLDEADVASSFELRCASGVGPEAVVAVVSAESCLNIGELLETAGRRRGVAVLVVGACASANGRISVAPDGSCTIEPLGLHVQAPAVTVRAATELTELLDQVVAAESSGSDVMEEEGDPSSLLTVLPATAEADAPETEPVEQVALAPDQISWLTDGSVDLNLVGSELDRHDSWERPCAPLTIRLLGEPKASGFDLSARQLGLLALIASKGGASSAECVLDHLWADQSNARTRKTLWNLESKTRTLVGPEILHLSPKNQPLRTSATTDVLLFEALVARSADVCSSEAIPLLAEALDLIDGAPFDHSQFEWARSIGIYEPTRRMIETAALRLCDLALEGGEHDIARRAIERGLRGLGVNEPLYQARMRVEANSGNHAAIVRIYRELEERLEILFDDATPSAETRRLLNELLNPGESAHPDKQSA